MRRLLPEWVEIWFRNGSSHGDLDAVTLFVDISGFTPMTEALMRHGKAGAESLADVLVSVFDPLVAAIHGHSGEILSFAGDAFTAMFPIDSRHDSLQVHLRAVAAATEMLHEIAAAPQRETAHGSFAFSIRVGLANGRVSWRIFRSRSQPTQATYGFRGPAIDDCAMAEHHAERGGLVVTEEVAAVVGGALTTAAIEGQPRYRRVIGNTTELPARVVTSRRAPDPAVTRAFFPTEIIESADRGELRWVVTTFISLPMATTDAAITTAMPSTLTRSCIQMGRGRSRSLPTTVKSPATRPVGSAT